MTKLQSRIEFVHALVAYGEQKLGLRFAGSFARYDSRRSQAHWLYSVHPDRLESALKDNEPFRFSWDLARVRRWERDERRRGRHTYLYSAEAHGGVACPVLPGLLRASRARQGYVVLHEAWHVTLRIEQIRMPYVLEEATGRVVGVMGAIDFAERFGDRELLAAARAQARDWGRLAGFINRSARRLQRAGREAASGQGRRRLLREFGREALDLREEITSPWECEELTREINNAFIFRYAAYTQFYPLALRVYKRIGSLRRTLNLYKHAGQTGAIRELRRAAANR